MADSEKPQRSGLTPTDAWLTGQFLIAMPGMPDPRFTHAVIYICSHGPNGAMGLIINRLFGEADFEMLLSQLEIKTSGDVPDVPVHFGGPVEPGRGFVLHSDDYLREGTIRVGDGIALTATVEILDSIVKRAGPERLLMALGYTGWGAGQLEEEVKANGWLTVTADEDILFDPLIETKWNKSLAKIGISPLMLSGEAGHA
ncbi:MAG: YqgE/AlgH family protein [Pseudomonadota bacterium]|nr:YqgE/AlgH family protein [Pseudomonadota bacterium]